MKIKCVVCKRKVDEEGMLWLVEGGGSICTGCFDRKLKEGITYIVQPHGACVLGEEVK